MSEHEMPDSLRELLTGIGIDPDQVTVVGMEFPEDALDVGGIVKLMIDVRRGGGLSQAIDVGLELLASQLFFPDSDHTAEELLEISSTCLEGVDELETIVSRLDAYTASNPVDDKTPEILETLAKMHASVGVQRERIAYAETKIKERG